MRIVKRKSTWTEAQDIDLMRAYRVHGPDWHKISQLIPGKTAAQCLHRFTKVLHPGISKVPWLPFEDSCLLDLVNKHGEKDWVVISEEIGGHRTGKQCRERWNNYLRKELLSPKDAPFTEAEDKFLIDLVTMWISKDGIPWETIKIFMPKRSANTLKNRFYSNTTKRQLVELMEKNAPDNKLLVKYKKQVEMLSLSPYDW